MKLRFYGQTCLAIIAEYVHNWATSICSEYADYARIALYERGGLFGDPGDDGNIWEWQRAELPCLADFGISDQPTMTLTL